MNQKRMGPETDLRTAEATFTVYGGNEYTRLVHTVV